MKPSLSCPFQKNMIRLISTIFCMLASHKSNNFRYFREYWTWAKCHCVLYLCNVSCDASYEGWGVFFEEEFWFITAWIFFFPTLAIISIYYTNIVHWMGKPCSQAGYKPYDCTWNVGNVGLGLGLIVWVWLLAFPNPSHFQVIKYLQHIWYCPQDNNARSSTL